MTRFPRFLTGSRTDIGESCRASKRTIVDVGLRTISVLAAASFGLWIVDATLSEHLTIKPLTQSKELVVAIAPYPGVYESQASALSRGFEHDLLSILARSQNLEPRFVTVDSFAQSRHLLRLGKVHMAALRLPSLSTQTGWRSFRESHPYLTTDFLLVTPKNGPSKDKPIDWFRRRVVVPTLSFGERLRCLGHRLEAPDGWIAVNSPWKAFEKLDRQTAEATIVDNETFNLARHRFPRLESRAILAENIDIGFVFSSQLDEGSIAAVNDFIEHAMSDGLIDRLVERYFGDLNRLTDRDIALFVARIDRVLPNYLPVFLEAEHQTGLDWRLIAALAYQESHWDPDAVSPTNVRGFMMLTADTARYLGVVDRDNVQQNVLAGAQYLLMLRNRLPETIAEPQRTWMALAAYNLGFRALSAGRLLAETREANSHHWHELKPVLGDLSASKLVRDRGIVHARGGEAAIMVDRVRAFYRILCLHTDFKSNDLSRSSK